MQPNIKSNFTLPPPLCPAVASFMLLILMNTGGFIVNKNDIKLWWKAVYWVSPTAYFVLCAGANKNDIKL